MTLRDSAEDTSRDPFFLSPDLVEESKSEVFEVDHNDTCEVSEEPLTKSGNVESFQINRPECPIETNELAPAECFDETFRVREDDDDNPNFDLATIGFTNLSFENVDFTDPVANFRPDNSIFFIEEGNVEGWQSENFRFLEIWRFTGINGGNFLEVNSAGADIVYQEAPANIPYDVRTQINLSLKNRANTVETMTVRLEQVAPEQIVYSETSFTVASLLWGSYSTRRFTIPAFTGTMRLSLSTKKNNSVQSHVDEINFTLDRL